MITKRGLRNVRRSRYRVKCDPIAGWNNNVPYFANEVKNLNNGKNPRFSDTLRIIHGIDINKSDVKLEYSFIVKSEESPMTIDILTEIRRVGRIANGKVFRGEEVEAERQAIFELRKEYIVMRELTKS